MTLWWIGDVLLLVVVLPVVVYLLSRVLRGREGHRAERRSGSPRAAAAGSKDLDAAAAARHDAGPGGADGRGRRGLRRLPRRDPRRRDWRSDVRQPAVVMIVAVVLIVLALVYYLVSTIVALRKITAGLDEVIAGVGEILEKSAPVNEIVNSINEQLDAGVDLLEGLLVKKAGMVDAVGLVDGLYPGAARPGLPQLPGEPGHRRAAHRRGLHARAR